MTFFSPADSKIVFPVVLVGWIVSLCLHEFAHALVAYLGGDTSVRDKGYLSFNPLRYIHPQFSILYPLLFLLIGGLGLPGGAVYINRSQLRAPFWGSLVSLAGPGANALLAIVLGLAIHLSPALQSGSVGAALAFLTQLQITAVVFNLLPVPPLDGFGAISPFLPREVRQQALSLGSNAMFLLIGAFWFVPGLSSAFWSAVNALGAPLGVEPALAFIGRRAFQFWLH